MTTENITKIDLDLKDLNDYHGTEHYYEYNAVGIDALGTDGTEYVSNNGYWWAVWDALVICQMELKEQKHTILIELKVENGEADIIYKSLYGDDKVLFEQHYDITDAKRGFYMYYSPSEKIICLSGED